MENLGSPQLEKKLSGLSLGLWFGAERTASERCTPSALSTYQKFRKIERCNVEDQMSYA